MLLVRVLRVRYIWIPGPCEDREVTTGAAGRGVLVEFDAWQIPDDKSGLRGWRREWRLPCGACWVMAVHALLSALQSQKANETTKWVIRAAYTPR